MLIFVGILSRIQAEVRTYWQWIRHNESRVPAGKKLLRVNLDETCVSMAPESDTGLILIRSQPDAKAYISKHQSTTNLAYVATVCDDPALQKHKPHFIIGSKAKINNSHFASMQSSSRSNVHVWRNEHKAWNNSFLMRRMLQHINDAASHKKDVQVCLIMDVAPCHIHESVMRKARSLGIMLVFVPAQITFLLQPLDTHAFASFKRWLRAQFTALQSTSPQGVVDNLQWLQVLQNAKAEFFDTKAWATGFSHTGARRPCIRITKALQKYVELEQVRTAPAQEPTEDMLTSVWPRRRKMLYAHKLLFQPHADGGPEQASPSRATSIKRVLAGPMVSVALASRSNKRACREFPTRTSA